MAELKTFLFTDICRSVDLKNEMVGRSVTERDQAYIETILTPHRGRIVEQLESHGGRVVSTAGDGHFLVFSNTVDAAQWAIQVQQSHRDTPITTPQGEQVEVRISVHVGVPQVDPADPDNFVGKTVDYASRLNDYASGGQILVSRSVMAILDDVGLEGIQLHLHGRRPLKGIGRVEVHELIYEDSGPRSMRDLPAKHHSDREWTVIPATEFYDGSGASQLDSNATGSLALERPLKRVGHYQLEELIGCGGMGDVYKARHIQFGRIRAVKVIKPQFVATGHQEIIRRFYHEIKAIGALEHKHIVVAIDSSSPTDRIHYLVMEYIHGVGLHELIQQHGPLNVPDACEIIRQAALGLQYIHGHNMVHRDIKPSNLMLTLVEGDDLTPSKQGAPSTTPSAHGPSAHGDSSRDEQGLVKILDLGLALLATEDEERLTRLENSAMGTGMYMSPEQWKTSSVDIRADIYSLGCTLYHLLAGSPPFHSSDLRPEIAHEKSKIPTIRAPAPIPRNLWDILCKMLAKNAQDRYQAPAEVATALAPLAAQHQLVRLVHSYGEAGLEAPDTISTQQESFTRVDTRSRQSSRTSSRASIRLPRKMLLGLGAIALFAGLLTTTYWWQAKVNPEMATVRDGIATLPGLNGSWWFHEIPWFTPSIRKQWIDLINGGQYVFNDISVKRLEQLHQSGQVPQFYQALEQVTTDILSSLPNSQQAIRHTLDRALLTLGSSDLAPYEEGVSNALDQLSKLPEKTVADHHLAAVLHHSLAHWKESEQAYQAALAAIASEPTDSMRPLILLDYGRMQLDSKQYDQAVSHFIEVRNQAKSSLLEMVSLCLEAEADYRSSHDPRLEHPLKLMDQANQQSFLDRNHPLRAYLLERQGWILNEAWHFSKAIKSFKSSIAIIQQQMDLEPPNRTIPVLELWARQGEATAVNFRDGPETARKLYLRLVDDIEQTLIYRADAPERFRELTPRQRQMFSERMPSISLRLGDCALRLQQQSGDSQASWDEAAKWYGRCIDDSIDLHWEQADRRARWVIDWRYKQCLPAILSGQLDLARTRYEKTQKREDELLSKGTLLKAHLNTFAFTKHLVDALIKIHSVETKPHSLEGQPADQPELTELGLRAEGKKELLTEVLELKTWQLGRHKLGSYVLAVEQLAPRLVDNPKQLRQLASHFHYQFVVQSRTGSKPELLPYLQPTLVILRNALQEANQKKSDPSLKRVLDYLAELIDPPKSNPHPADHGNTTTQ